MADFLSIPPSTATDGERAFYNRIEQIFSEENHIIGYFEPDIGGLHPDFLLLSPKYGVIIVEIKDYLDDYLKAVPKSGAWERLKDEEICQIENPFDQVYQYWREIKNRINKCKFPEDKEISIIRLVVFSKISKNSYVCKKIQDNTPNMINLCFKETLSRNDQFEELISDIVPLNLELTSDDFKLIRANIIPTCRLPTPQQADLLEYFSFEDKVKILDNEQEKLARELGEGHRLIFGVAGSGKTVILIARARILARRHPDWKILILCYNKLLKKLLFNMLNPQDYQADITISTFHAWARSYILNSTNYFYTLYKKAENNAEKEEKMTRFFKDFVPDILLQLIKSQGENKQLYDAILIDEAQDFDKSWFLPIMQLLNPEMNSLLITCDGLQGIYARKRFYWSDVGIQARGRTRRFEKSYRIPIEIGILAQATLPESLKSLIDQFDEFISTKEFIGDHGIVEIVIFTSREEEYMKLAEKIARLLKNPQEVLVLFKQNMAKLEYKHPFFNYLKQFNIEWKDLKYYSYKTPELLVGTLHGTKGLESDTIIIPELDTYNSSKDRQLLYVGMTRSRKKLVLSANKSTELIKSLESYQHSE